MTMNLAIMQPYFFPYIGYFQLLGNVEKFVFYDDVNFIKQGWINRNRICTAGNVKYITVPTRNGGSFVKICEVEIDARAPWQRKILGSVAHSYGKAPFFRSVYGLVEEVLSGHEVSISDLAKASVMRIARHLGIEVEFRMTSSDYGNQQLRGAERVLDICHREHASQYTNLPGGKSLYDQECFSRQGLALRFVDTRLDTYRQPGSAEFVPALSIIDVLMHNSVSDVRKMLECGVG